MRSAVAALLLALSACAGPVRAPAAVPDLEPEPQHLPLPPPDPGRSVEASLEGWRALGLTGDNWEETLADVRGDDDTRAAMARTLLLAGGFECRDVEVAVGCGESSATMNEVRLEATFEDPCLRRALAVWAIEQLTGDDATAVEPALRELVALGDAELELQDAAFALVPDDAEDLLLRLMAATSATRANDQVARLVSDDAVLHAATVLHLDAAVTRLDRDLHHAARVAAIGDPRLATETRTELIDDLADESDAATVAALVAAADTDDDCAVAWRAAASLAERGDRGHLPARPRSHDLAAHARALCVLAHSDLDDRDARFAAWIGRRGLDWIDRHDHADYDPADRDDVDGITRDGDVTTERRGSVTITTTHAARRDVELDALGYVVGSITHASSWRCADGRCAVGAIGLGFARAGRSEVLTTVWTENGGDGGC